jgi:Zn-dependent M28 family amino/carboxypeptidase
MKARADGRTFIQPSNQSLTIQMRVVEQSTTVPNVVGWLPGSDPNLQHEYIVMGAHLDHLGVKAGFVFPGADDNGSGSTALLSVARAMTVNDVRPKRSVLFMWFAAEEIGLIGSKYYCDHPVLPLQNMISMLNIDMVGRNEESASERASDNVDSIHLIGSQKGRTQLHQLIQDANRYVGFRFEYDEESIFDRSDQYNFYAKGVPVSFLFGGFHPDYHEPTDTIEKINFQKVISAARLYYAAAFLVADHGRFRLVRE